MGILQLVQSAVYYVQGGVPLVRVYQELVL